MNAEILEMLGEELPVDIKPGAGNYKYVKTKYVIQKLNQAFGGLWSSEVKGWEKTDKEIVVWVRVYHVDEKGATICFHDGFGSAQIFDRIDIGNTFKSAKSRAVKDAVKFWGVALDLENSMTAQPNTTAPAGPPMGGHAPMSNQPPMNNTTTPTSVGPAMGGMPPATNTPPVNNAPPTNTAPPTTTAPTNNVQEAGVQSGGFPVDMHGDTTTPFDAPAPNNTPAANTAETVGAGSGMPSFPAAETIGANQGNKNDNPAVNPAVKITQVQKTAIENQLNIKGKDFKTYATEAFTAKGLDVSRIPESIDDLSYEDAMVLASYAN